MILCKDDCIPCCDYCVHAIHDMGEINGKIVRLGPIDCGLHNDKEHENFAVSCYYCEDFHCTHAT